MLYNFFILAVLVLLPLIDQLTKWGVMALTEQGSHVVTIIPGVLRFKILYNSGASMGMFAGSTWGRVFFMVLSALAIIGIAVVLFGFRKKLGLGHLATFSLATVAGGGIGNMIDRTFYGDTLFTGSVIDFIDFHAFPKIWKWTFNFADICVCVGVALFALAVIASEIKLYKESKAQKTVSSSNQNADEEPKP